jgi:hypothetical protein
MLGQTDLLATAWRRSPPNLRSIKETVTQIADTLDVEDSGSALQLQVVEDYGGAGGFADWNDKPTFPVPWPTTPKNPTYNELEAVPWGEEVVYTEDALTGPLAASLVTLPYQSPLVYVPAPNTVLIVDTT